MLEAVEGKGREMSTSGAGRPHWDRTSVFAAKPLDVSLSIRGEAQSFGFALLRYSVSIFLNEAGKLLNFFFKPGIRCCLMIAVGESFSQVNCRL